MELKLLQSEVAIIFNISTDCITYWENNRSTPQVNFIPQIIEFLGYCPIEFDESTLSGRLMAYRWRNGFSYKRLGRILGVDGTTIGVWEKGEKLPSQRKVKVLEKLLSKRV